MTQHTSSPNDEPPPSARFGTPQRLLDDARLSLTEKRRLLEEWEDDIRAELVATEEGMNGPSGVTLADIMAAKDKLPIDTPPRPSDSKA